MADTKRSVAILASQAAAMVDGAVALLELHDAGDCDHYDHARDTALRMAKCAADDLRRVVEECGGP